VRKEQGLLILSLILLLAASFCHLYTKRSTGWLPVITHPYRDYALPLAALGAVALALGLYLGLRREEIPHPSSGFSNLAFFIVMALIMKVAAEVMHEVGGHGLYVLLFGGRILRVRISLLWPLRTSYIWWDLPDLAPWQRGLIIGGGILNCLLISFALQLLLLLRPQPWRLGTLLLWFAYWNYISSAGYLLSGGYGAFGDVADLIKMGILTPLSSLLLGLLVSIAGYLLLSINLRRLLMPLVSADRLGHAVAAFWLTTALVVVLMILNPQVRAPVTLIPLGFIPTLLWLLLETLWGKRNESPSIFT